MGAKCSRLPPVLIILSCGIYSYTLIAHADPREKAQRVSAGLYVFLSPLGSVSYSAVAGASAAGVSVAAGAS
ncbi:hypothetical protein, partial [uncultured Duncaniella sp.]|uniref:hypothetical protein n=1 Tax=uncultured Duncaniella sp. TaxID=2768039 RepID=UPI0025AA067E